MLDGALGGLRAQPRRPLAAQVVERGFSYTQWPAATVRPVRGQRAGAPSCRTRSGVAGRRGPAVTRGGSGCADRPMLRRSPAGRQSRRRSPPKEALGSGHASPRCRRAVFDEAGREIRAPMPADAPDVRSDTCSRRASARSAEPGPTRGAALARDHRKLPMHTAPRRRLSRMRSSAQLRGAGRDRVSLRVRARSIAGQAAPPSSEGLGSARHPRASSAPTAFFFFPRRTSPTPGACRCPVRYAEFDPTSAGVRRSLEARSNRAGRWHWSVRSGPTEIRSATCLPQLPHAEGSRW